jgi:hypothetical protein
MGLFLTTLFLCSSMQGVVVHQGQPISDATVIREVRWSWGKESYHDVVQTDQEGRFAFKEITHDAFWAPWVPHEPIVRQTITIEWQGKRYPAYFHDKGNYDAGGEFGQERLHFRCDLSESLRNHTAGEFREYSGICTLVTP